jgi:ATP-dependent DNA helicase DinG
VPGDPLEDAVCEEIAARTGRSSFEMRSVPQASTALAQAAGRLIRSMTDRGAVVVLDNRIVSGQRWVRPLLRALPPFPRSADIGDVGRAIAGEPLAGSSVPVGEHADQAVLPLTNIGAPLPRRRR